MDTVKFFAGTRPGRRIEAVVFASQSPQDNRVAWVDYAKGWSIILVVTMHSALGVGFAVGRTGWLHELVAFAKPFRMPDFFLVAGLFAGRIIVQPWPRFIDRKILHFAYFYALWLFISLVVKSGEFDLRTPDAFLKAYLYGFVQPFSSMWFIHLLPILFLATRLTKNWPAPLLLAVATIMHVMAARYPDGGVYAMSSIMTGWVTVDSFFLFFIYFLCGCLFTNNIFVFSAQVARRPGVALIGFALWAVIEAAAVKMGLSEIPGATLGFGLAGAFAVVTLSTLLAKAQLIRWLSYCGRNSLVIYLSFFLPMAATRTLLVKTVLVSDVGLMSLIVAAVAIASPLVLDSLVMGTPLGFLFKRPVWARLERSSDTPRLTACKFDEERDLPSEETIKTLGA